MKFLITLAKVIIGFLTTLSIIGIGLVVFHSQERFVLIVLNVSAIVGAYLVGDWVWDYVKYKSKQWNMPPITKYINSNGLERNDG